MCVRGHALPTDCLALSPSTTNTPTPATNNKIGTRTRYPLMECSHAGTLKTSQARYILKRDYYITNFRDANKHNLN